MAKPRGTQESGKLGLDQLITSQNEQYGLGTLFTGLDLKRDPYRLPTGVFTVDYVIGGGLPIWGTTCFWGPEMSGKSSLALNAVEMVDRLCWRCYKLKEFCECSQPPISMRSVWEDVEGTLDREWAACIGARPESYVVALADYGEAYVNIAERALSAHDCALLVIDSLAALTPEAQFEAPAEDQFIGRQAAMIGNAVRKLKQRLIRERKAEHPCTILFVNQLRTKIGQMFGDPETMPGGHAMKHEFSLLLKMVKKALDKSGTDSKFMIESRKKEAAVRHAFTLRKEKVLTIAGSGEFTRVREEMSELGLRKGQVDDFGTLMTYAREYGVVTKDEGSGKWMYFDMEASKLEVIKEVWRVNRHQYLRTSMEIVNRAKERLRGSSSQR